MAYNNNNNDSSPAKFITALFGARQLRREQRAANEDLGNQMDHWEDTKMKNPYAGVKNPYESMENVYEDQTVNLKQAEFEKEQSQGVKQAQQASVSIGAQEKMNQTNMLAESGRLQQLKAQGEQQRDLLEREGAKMVEQFDLNKQDKMLEFAMARKDAADTSVDAQNAAIDKFVGGAAQVGLKALTGGVL